MGPRLAPPTPSADRGADRGADPLRRRRAHAARVALCLRIVQSPHPDRLPTRSSGLGEVTGLYVYGLSYTLLGGTDGFLWMGLYFTGVMPMDWPLLHWGSCPLIAALL